MAGGRDRVFVTVVTVATGHVVASGRAIQPFPNLNDVRGDEVTAQGLRACARPRPIRLARV